MNVPYNERSIHERIGGLAGKPAENAFVAVMQDQGRELGKHVFRFGFDQVSTTDGVVATFPPVLRHTPDFVSVGGHIWECQGCGVDRMITIKEDKLSDLLKWQQFINRSLRWSFYVQPDDIVLFATTDAVLWAINHEDTQTTVLDPDTSAPKKAWRVPVSVFMERRVKDAFAAERKANAA